MTTGTSAIAEYIRTHKGAIAEEWERTVVRDNPLLAGMERGVLLDHLPEVLDGLASYIQGHSDDADRAFSALADGHALQRLGFGVELEVVNVEYARLRRVLLKALLAVPSSPEIAEALIVLNEGLDRAIDLSVRRYMGRREYVRERFVGILGHDLRDSLSAISAATAALLRGTKHTEAEQRALLVTERATTRMGRLIGDVLDFARSHLGGGIPASPSECDMGEICRVAVEEAVHAHRDRDIRLECSGDLRGTFDPDRTHQVFANLLSNALKHGVGPIVVSVQEAEDRRAISTMVKSHGRPIPADIARKLFEPFERGADSSKSGLGLGLYIVAQVARAHGATCSVSSTEDETVFSVRWPRTPREEIQNRP